MTRNDQEAGSSTLVGTKALGASMPSAASSRSPVPAHEEGLQASKQVLDQCLCRVGGTMDEPPTLIAHDSGDSYWSLLSRWYGNLDRRRSVRTGWILSPVWGRI